jgi:hypothetical protein
MPKKDASEAAMKRSIARRFNDSLIGRSSRSASDKTLDRRTAKKLERFRQELKNSRKAGSKDLTPLDVAIRVNELLKHGDRLTDIKKLSKPRSIEYNEETLVGVLREMQPIYQFRVEAYRHAGVKNETLVAAGVLESMPAKRGPAPGSKPAAKRGARRASGRRRGK